MLSQKQNFQVSKENLCPVWVHLVPKVEPFQRTMLKY